MKYENKVLMWIIIIGLLMVGGIVYSIIIATTGKVNTSLERTKYCKEMGYKTHVPVGEGYYNCCRDVFNEIDGEYVKEKECKAIKTYEENPNKAIELKCTPERVIENGTHFHGMREGVTTTPGGTEIVCERVK